MASLDENYPEVYNYFVTVSLLPLNFMTGAVLKYTEEELDDLKDKEPTVSIDLPPSRSTTTITRPTNTTNSTTKTTTTKTARKKTVSNITFKL